ncbi:MAG: domain S-box protein [Chitinophagaceae bacterium]|nr:domain S-box protein [Chitinophagaceae bacterium]
MKPSSTAGKKIPLHKFKNKKPIFPIVAIGSSTGGLDAMSQLLKNLSANTGMAFIYVQHLSPDHKSILTSILAKLTKMKVQQIENMEQMEPNNVYVIPHDKAIKVTDGHIQLLSRRKNSSTDLSIDLLFSSLAETHQENVVGIILSGNAHDGTIGLKAIKAAGGITFAQDQSAQAGSMPESAIASGVVDFILSPAAMARKLARLNKGGLLVRKEKILSLKTIAIEEHHTDLKLIFELLQKNTGVDFSHYKMNTINRRLNNRMLQSGVKTTKDYAKLLLKKNSEIKLLYKDLLINVTSFFRDTDIFLYLKNVFFPILLKNKGVNETLRIWIPACSRGEEAYSVAMLLVELQETKKIKIPVQIFATDLSESSIKYARSGIYTKSDMKPVSAKRIKRFFTTKGDQFQVVKELRDMCVFAPHNILSDPPFFRMDFISCRNLLIYFDAAAQKKALAIFHFALNDRKYLMLGKAETIGTASLLFNQLNNKFKIYGRKKNIGVRKVPELAPRMPNKMLYEKNIKSITKKLYAVHAKELDGAIDHILLSSYMPACAIINKDMEIIQFRGSTSLYLSHTSGKASLNILKMIRPEFAFELRNAIHQVIKTNQPVRKSGIEIASDMSGSNDQLMSLEVSSLKIEWDEPLLLVIFSLQEQVETFIENDKARKKNATQKDLKIKKLTTELNQARAEIHAVIELQEAAYEELQAANEEIVSTNEEFQTLNEELETSKEEIEATNEELISSNQELKVHNELLEESYNYSQTIIATIHEPMLVLDSNLRVKSANKSFYKKFLVSQEHTEGMHLFELGNKQWDIPQLRELLKDSLNKNYQFENFEVTHVFPRLGEKVMLLNASRIIQKTHREKLILLAIRDITERAHYYLNEKALHKKDIGIHEANNLELEKAVSSRTKQLHNQNIQLENANKDLRSFTYVSSHDLQEPLRKIQNFVGCLMDEEEENLSVEGKFYLRKTHETAQRMQALIEDLLTYSRATNTDRLFERMNLQVVIEEVKKEFEEILKTKKAIVKIGKLCEASIIHFQFRQLFQNLLSNSLKFSKTDVPPRISIESRTAKGSTLNNKKLNAKTDYCHIIFKDNGIGFDPQYNEKIFEVFQHLHSREAYKGNGMGLAICKRIVENHNGIIIATGIPDKGVTFEIYIPV